VRLAARAFYDDISMKGDNQPKTSRGDNRGMAVVVLDALTRYCPMISVELLCLLNEVFLCVHTKIGYNMFGVVDGCFEQMICC
jgi:hypothetical protein